MLNIFYNPIYIKQKKVLLTKRFKHSIFSNYLIDFCYIFNLPINENFIQSGPHKRMNNLIKTFKEDKEACFNKLKFNCTYLVQFDEFGQDLVDKIIKLDNPNKRVLIGPLYNIEQDKKINQLVKNYPYIKKLVASDIAFKNAKELDTGFIHESTIVLPSGIDSEINIMKNLNIKNRNDKCLIYFKKRDREDLNLLISFLNYKNQEYELFEYGKYDNKKLKKIAKTSKFAIIVSCSESQGFGIQEIMGQNIPLLVWDQTVNYFDNFKLSGTSVTVWDKLCGEKVNTFDELKDTYDYFLNNLEKYRPAEVVLDKLTYEVFNKNLKEVFS